MVGLWTVLTEVFNDTLRWYFH